MRDVYPSPFTLHVSSYKKNNVPVVRHKHRAAIVIFQCESKSFQVSFNLKLSIVCFAVDNDCVWNYDFIFRGFKVFELEVCKIYGVESECIRPVVWFRSSYCADKKRPPESSASW